VCVCVCVCVFVFAVSNVLSGVVPLDSLVRVLLSSNEFQPRLSSEDIRILMVGLQVAAPITHLCRSRSNVLSS
jgi:hypothetical protein